MTLMSNMEIERFNVAEAKQRFSDLLGRVAYGRERVMITRRGRPMAMLVPVEAEPHDAGLAATEGWLDDSDPFFAEIAAIVSDRASHTPRMLRSEDEPVR